MPQLHIITLKERRSQIEEEVNRMGIDAVYWPAIILPNTINGVAASHKKIVQYALDNNLPEIFIGEDDLIFTSISGWRYFLDNKPYDFDIYLSGYYSGIPLNDGTLYSFAGLQCYCVHSRFYKTFLSTPLHRNIDKVLAGSGKFIPCSPLVTKQRNGYSFHRKKIVDDDHYLQGKQFLS